MRIKPGWLAGQRGCWRCCAGKAAWRDATAGPAAGRCVLRAPGVVYSSRISGASLTRSDWMPFLASSDVSLFHTCSAGHAPAACAVLRMLVGVC